MKDVLNNLTIFFTGIIKWIPITANAALGAIGKFFDAFGYVRAIIIGIFGALAAILAWIWRRLNR